jgi:hypothetical protein
MAKTDRLYKGYNDRTSALAWMLENYRDPREVTGKQIEDVVCVGGRWH